MLGGLGDQIKVLKDQFSQLVHQKSSDEYKHAQDIFSKLELQLSDSEEGLHKRFDLVTSMIQAQEQKLLETMKKYHKATEKQNDVHHEEVKQWAEGLENHLKDLK